MQALLCCDNLAYRFVCHPPFLVIESLHDELLVDFLHTPFMLKIIHPYPLLLVDFKHTPFVLKLIHPHPCSMDIPSPDSLGLAPISCNTLIQKLSLPTLIRVLVDSKTSLVLVT